jgi:hypothetical protein
MSVAERTRAQPQKRAGPGAAIATDFFVTSDFRG